MLAFMRPSSPGGHTPAGRASTAKATLSAAVRSPDLERRGPQPEHGDYRQRDRAKLGAELADRR
jgi:hypothetical protein